MSRKPDNIVVINDVFSNIAWYEKRFIKAAVMDWANNKCSRAAPREHRSPMTVSEFLAPDNIEEFKDFARGTLLKGLQGGTIKLEGAEARRDATVGIVASLMFDFFLFTHTIYQSNKKSIWSKKEVEDQLGKAIIRFNQIQAQMERGEYDDGGVFRALQRFNRGGVKKQSTEVTGRKAIMYIAKDERICVKAAREKGSLFYEKHRDETHDVEFRQDGTSLNVYVSIDKVVCKDPGLQLFFRSSELRAELSEIEGGGSVTWHCEIDEDGKVASIFSPLFPEHPIVCQQDYDSLIRNKIKGWPHEKIGPGFNLADHFLEKSFESMLLAGYQIANKVYNAIGSEIFIRLLERRGVDLGRIGVLWLRILREDLKAGGANFSALITLASKPLVAYYLEEILREMTGVTGLADSDYKVFLDKGFRVNDKIFYGIPYFKSIMTQFTRLLKPGNTLAVVDFLEKHGVSFLGTRANHKRTDVTGPLLSVMLHANRGDIVIGLLSNKKYKGHLDIHEVDSKGKIPFENAYDLKNYSVMAAFYKNDIHVDKKWYEYARSNNDAAVSALLVECDGFHHCLGLNDADEDGNTALHHAVLHKNQAMVEDLMRFDPPPELKENKAGDTPLDLFSITPGIATILIKRATEAQQKSALDKAYKALPDHPEKVTLLLELGVKAKRKKAKFYLSANEKEFNGLLDQYEERRINDLVTLIYQGNVPSEHSDLLLIALNRVLDAKRSSFDFYDSVEENSKASIQFLKHYPVAFAARDALSSSTLYRKISIMQENFFQLSCLIAERFFKKSPINMSLDILPDEDDLLASLIGDTPETLKELVLLLDHPDHSDWDNGVSNFFSLDARYHRQVFVCFVQHRIKHQDRFKDHRWALDPETSMPSSLLWAGILSFKKSAEKKIDKIQDGYRFAESMGISLCDVYSLSSGEKVNALIDAIQDGGYFYKSDIVQLNSYYDGLSGHLLKSTEFLSCAEKLDNIVNVIEYRCKEGLETGLFECATLVLQKLYAYQCLHYNISPSCSQEKVDAFIEEAIVVVKRILAADEAEWRALIEQHSQISHQWEQALASYQDLQKQICHGAHSKPHGLPIPLEDYDSQCDEIKQMEEKMGAGIPKTQLDSLVDHKARRVCIASMKEMIDNAEVIYRRLAESVDLLAAFHEGNKKSLLASEAHQKKSEELASKTGDYNALIDQCCASKPEDFKFSDAILKDHETIVKKLSRHKSVFFRKKTLNPIPFDKQYGTQFTVEQLDGFIADLAVYILRLGQEQGAINAELQSREKSLDRMKEELSHKGEKLEVLSNTVLQLCHDVQQYNNTIASSAVLSAPSILIDANDSLRKRINKFSFFEFRKSEPTELRIPLYCPDYCKMQYQTIEDLDRIIGEVGSLCQLLTHQRVADKEKIAAASLAAKKATVTVALTDFNAFKLTLVSRLKACSLVDTAVRLAEIDQITGGRIASVDQLASADEAQCKTYQNHVDSALELLKSIAPNVGQAEVDQAQILQGQATERQLAAEQAAAEEASAAAAKLAEEQAAQANVLAQRKAALDRIAFSLQKSLGQLHDLMEGFESDASVDVNTISKSIAAAEQISSPEFATQEDCVSAANAHKEAVESVLWKVTQRDEELWEETKAEYRAFQDAGKQLNAALAPLMDFPSIKAWGEEQYSRIGGRIGAFKAAAQRKNKSLKDRGDEIACLQGLTKALNEAICSLGSKVRDQGAVIEKAHTGAVENMEQVASDLQPYLNDHDFSRYSEQVDQFKAVQALPVSDFPNKDAMRSFWESRQAESVSLLADLAKCIQEKETAKAAAEREEAEAGRLADEEARLVNQHKKEIDHLQRHCTSHYNKINKGDPQGSSRHQERYERCCIAFSLSDPHDLKALQTMEGDLRGFYALLVAAECQVKKDLADKKKAVAGLITKIEKTIKALEEGPKNDSEYMSLHDQDENETIGWWTERLAAMQGHLETVQAKLIDKTSQDAAAKERAVHDLNEKIGELNTAVTKINDRLMKSTTGAQLDIDMVSGYTALRKSLDPEKRGFFGSLFSAAPPEDTRSTLLVIPREKASAAMDQMQPGLLHEVSGTVSAFIDTLVRKTEEVEADQHACDIQAVQEEIRAERDVLKAEYGAINCKSARVDSLLQEASSSEGSFADLNALLVRVKGGVNVLKIRGLKGKMKKIYKRLEADDRTEAEQANIEVLKKRAESIESFTSASPENVKYCEELYADFEKLSTQFVDNGSIKVQIEEVRRQIDRRRRAIKLEGNSIARKEASSEKIEEIKGKLKASKTELRALNTKLEECSVEGDFADSLKAYSALLESVRAFAPGCQDSSGPGSQGGGPPGHVPDPHSPERFFAVAGKNSSDPVPRALNDLRDDVRAYYRQARSPEDIYCVQKIVEAINARRSKYGPDRINAEIKGLFEPYINAQEAVVRIGPMLESVAEGESISAGLRAHLEAALETYDPELCRKTCQASKASAGITI